VAKLAAEHLSRLYHGNHGVPAVILRYFTVYGPRQRPDMAFHRFCRAAIDGLPLNVFGEGDQIRDFTYVADAVSATRSAAETPAAAGEIYNIGGGSQVELRHAIQLLGDFAGRPIAVEHRQAQPGDVRATGADITRARVDLGYEPSVRFDDGLRAEFDWVRPGPPPAPPLSQAASVRLGCA
jgi:nucleoside-diphosphate-sugar epimerase